MRILAITNLYPNPQQPHRASFNRRQLAALAQQHEVRVVAPVSWTVRMSARERSRRADGMLIEHPRYLYTPRAMRRWYGHFYMQSVRPCFEQTVKTFEPHVLLGSWAYPDGWAALRLGRASGIPVAVKVHGSDLMNVDPSSPRYERAMQVMTGADAVIAVGSQLREKALAMGAEPRRVHLVPNGIDTALFRRDGRGKSRQRLGVPADSPLIVFVGNLVHVKGIDVLIDALAVMERKGAKFRCVCIGDGPLRAELRARAFNNGLESRLAFLGAKSQAELADWYRAADIVVLPSRSEGVPNVLLEASACGAPIVASDVGGVADIIDRAGLVPAGDPQALAQRLTLFLHPHFRPPLAQRVRTLSWSESARALSQVLAGITARAARSAAA